MSTMEGERVILRPARQSDIDDRLRLGPNPEYHLCFGDDEIIMRSRSELQEMWFDDVEDANDDRFRKADLQIAQIEIKGKWAGSVSLAKIDFHHRRADLVVGIYDRKYWGEGYGTEAMRLTLEYAFDRLSLHRVSGNIISTNQRSLAGSRKVGFRTEGVSRDYFCVNGKWFDSVRVAILDYEFRALEESRKIELSTG